MKKLAVYTGYSAVILLIATAVFTYIAPHFGWRVDAVVSGSMEPQLKTGSVVVIKPVEPETIEEGDIITFCLPGIKNNVVTHRVIEIGHNSPLYYRTRGDANVKSDPFTVPVNNVIGKVVLNIPLLGHLLEFLKTIYGLLFAVIFPGLSIITIYAWSVWKEFSGKKNNRLRAVENDS